MITLGELESKFQVSVLDYLDRDAEIPTVTTAACQGDISFLRVTTKAATTEIPKVGVVIATGRGGHDHRLLPGGLFDFAPTQTGSIVIGTLTVPENSEVFALHDEHGGLRFAPGTWRVGRQREQADDIRRVED